MPRSPADWRAIDVTLWRGINLTRHGGGAPQCAGVRRHRDVNSGPVRTADGTGINYSGSRIHPDPPGGGEWVRRAWGNPEPLVRGDSALPSKTGGVLTSRQNIVLLMPFALIGPEQSARASP